MAFLEDILEMGITDISDDILIKMERRANLESNFDRCVRFRICPKCGEDFVVEDKTKRENNRKTGGILLTCPSCNFVYKDNWS